MDLEIVFLYPSNWDEKWLVLKTSFLILMYPESHFLTFIFPASLSPPVTLPGHCSPQSHHELLEPN